MSAGPESFWSSDHPFDRAMQQILTPPSVLEQAGLAIATAAGKTSSGAPVDVKLVATLQARAALAGFELVPMPDGSFVVSRWAMLRALVDVAAVEAFLLQVGAK